MGVKFTKSGTKQHDVTELTPLRTAQTNLTSAVPTVSSAAQMLGENEDTYVQSYIQTQSMGIAFETLLMLQLLEHGENEG